VLGRDTENEQEKEYEGNEVSQIMDVERMDDGNKQEEQTQQEEESGTQMDINVSLEQNEEKDKEVENEDDNVAVSNKRRRSLQIKPNTERARKRATLKGEQKCLDGEERAKDSVEME